MELKAHFNRAAGTPFCTEPLLSLARPLGTSEASQAILSGNFRKHQGIDFWITQLIPFLTLCLM
jgi:hypothetical protein